ncbi:predicted protein [Postia placenta Mad-698-R]|uniref:DUF2470 domain-containing protein n=1 Tax=Postia placenta MAD-698-R-SB12 TaxID=670580 RepID=A0A1X6N291_9APHY|nr:hypothetical protein POSPLADRAFT_1046147 [Postia placenta MAD-698-R-SB12]EED77867.1 predicted protein [Postia placenta Mad-698-R]OSX62741.1 hypothetical protein POSPLADRAFT_1046147 [Postia placenta MAD-698-R-SB12]
MADPVAAKSGFLCMYMSNHPDTLVGYVKHHGNVKESVESAQMTVIDTKGMTLSYKVKGGGAGKQVRVPFDPPLAGYEEVKPRLLSMKVDAEEALGMARAPQVTTIRLPSLGLLTGGLMLLLFYVTWAPSPSSLHYRSDLFWPAHAIRTALPPWAVAASWWIMLPAHSLEALYTFTLCRKYRTPFGIGLQIPGYLRRNSHNMDLSDPNFLRTLAAWADTGQGRSLSELLNSNDPLQGPESQRLRSYFTSNWMEPDRDLDEYGRRIMMGDLASVQDDFARRESQHMAEADTTEAARADAAQELYSLRWGPTRVPIFNLILLCTLIEPRSRAGHLAIARWLIADAKVPVDGTDLSGSQAIYHTISTKPTFDPEYGQLLYDAGANVNHRNRYGGTAAHEMALIWDYTKKEPAQRAADGLAWEDERRKRLGMKILLAMQEGVVLRSSESMPEGRLAKAQTDVQSFEAIDRRDDLSGREACTLGRTTIQKCIAFRATVFFSALNA